MNNLGSRTIETEKLILKAQTMDEQEYLWSVLMMPKVNKYYLTVPIFLREKLKDWNKQKEYYQDEMKHANDVDVYKWSMFLKDTGECIGRVTCQESDVSDPAIRDVGWYIDPKYQGFGYGTEAAKAMIEYMFNEVGINEIRTGAAVINSASWRIMEKLGFVRTDNTKMVQYTYLDEPVEVYQYLLTKEMFYDFNNKKVLK
ncbi:MAG: GNAT family N-acetyltransferase [Bacilli bacterium]|nr:GNAT family N-acetyltransferase [Bacilli bacterium]